MKTIRSLMGLIGLSLATFALSAIGARAQAVTTPQFAGTFNLQSEARLGSAILPAGKYMLYYGRLHNDSPEMVEVVGKDRKSPHVLILPRGIKDASTPKSELVCVRERSALIVRGLEIPQLGKSVTFAMPHGAKLVAQNRKHDDYAQLASAPMLIERIPVTLNAK